MATNEILLFASSDTGTNLLTQAEYSADSQRPIGNQPGIARSKLVNKALRQQSLLSAGLAQYIANNQSNNIVDSLTAAQIADYLDAAISSMYPKMNSVTQLTGTTTLTNSGSQKFIRTVQCVSGGSYTVTAPLAADCPSGSIIRIMNCQSSGTITVARQGSNFFYPNGSTLTSVALGYGEEVDLTSTGNHFMLAGSAQALYTSGFACLKAANGYSKSPNGVIEQWGNGITSYGFVAVSFPQAFPNAATAFVMTISGATVNGTWAVVESSGLGTTGVNVYSAAFGTAGGGAANSGIAFHWRAIGY